MSNTFDFSKNTSFSGHSGAIYSLQFDGKFIYSASADKYVVRWNLETGEQDKFAIKLPSTPYSICLIKQQSKLIVGLSSGDLHVFDIEKKQEIKYFTLHREGIFSITENQLKQQFYVGDASGLVSIWNAQTLELLLQLPFDCGKIRRIIPSQDGSKIFLCCQDGFLRVVETTFFNLEYELFTHENGVASFLELDEHTFITGGKDALLKVWEKNVCVKTIPAHNFMIYDLLSIDENLFASASRDKTIKIWNKNDFSVLQRLDLKKGGHRHSVNYLQALSPFSFASASDDARILTWKQNDLF